MVKLTNKKIKWAVNQVVTNKKSTKSVANIYKVSQRRIQQLVKIYKDTGEYPQLKMNRRPKTYLTDKQKEISVEGHTHGRRKKRRTRPKEKKRGIKVRIYRSERGTKVSISSPNSKVEMIGSSCLLMLTLIQRRN